MKTKVCLKHFVSYCGCLELIFQRVKILSWAQYNFKIIDSCLQKFAWFDIEIYFSFPKTFKNLKMKSIATK